MGDVKVEFSDMNLGEKLLRKYRLSAMEATEVTKVGAEIHEKAIISELKSRNLKHSKGGLESGIDTAPSGLTDHSTVVGFANDAYYWHFVDEGHYQKYYGRIINNGNKYFAGYHFIEPAFQKALSLSGTAMHRKLEEIWRRHG